MRAAVFYGKGQPMKFEEVPKPSVKADEVLVKVAACGLCRTDLHYLHGTPTFKKPPLILGHEISGTVEEAGASVKNVKSGDKVLLPPVFSCGHCSACRSGRGTLCSNQIMLGNHVDGGFAEYVVAPGNSVFMMPNNVSLNEGSIIADAISTPYHAVVGRAKVKPGDSVAIFGCGGVGLSTVQMAAAVGAEVIAIDVFDQKLEAAKRFGASHTINAKTVEDLPKALRKLTGGGPDIALEVIGMPATIQQAFESVKWGGKLVVVGYSHENITINAGRIMFREIEIMGSLGCPLQDFPKVLDMVKMGRIRVEPMVTHKFRFEQLNEGLAALEKGAPDMIRSIVEM